MDISCGTNGRTDEFAGAFVGTGTLSGADEFTGALAGLDHYSGAGTRAGHAYARRGHGVHGRGTLRRAAHPGPAFVAGGGARPGRDAARRDLGLADEATMIGVYALAGLAGMAYVSFLRSCWEGF